MWIGRTSSLEGTAQTVQADEQPIFEDVAPDMSELEGQPTPGGGGGGGVRPDNMDSKSGAMSLRVRLGPGSIIDGAGIGTSSDDMDDAEGEEPNEEADALSRLKTDPAVKTLLIEHNLRLEIIFFSKRDMYD